MNTIFDLHITLLPAEKGESLPDYYTVRPLTQKGKEFLAQSGAYGEQLHLQSAAHRLYRQAWNAGLRISAEDSETFAGVSAEPLVEEAR